MDKATEAFLTIGAGIIGLATLAIIISKKSNAAGVIQNLASGFSNVLGVAVSPVTGSNVNINTAYSGTSPGSFAGMGGLGLSGFNTGSF